MSIMSVKIINDSTDKLLAQVGKMAGVAMESIGQEMERYAKDDCPVDTGNLKGSISHESTNKDAVVGSNVVYAARQEFGESYHHKVGKAHYLRDAAGNHTEHYKAILEAALASLTL